MANFYRPSYPLYLLPTLNIFHKQINIHIIYPNINKPIIDHYIYQNINKRSTRTRLNAMVLLFLSLINIQQLNHIILIISHLTIIMNLKHLFSNIFKSQLNILARLSTGLIKQPDPIGFHKLIHFTLFHFSLLLVINLISHQHINCLFITILRCLFVPIVQPLERTLTIFIKYDILTL